MRKTVTVRQIQNLDKIAINQYGVPSLALMENAGRGVACEVIGLLRRKRKRNVCVVCGLGNNAGDGFVIARHLINAGLNVKIFLVGKGSHLKHDAAVNYRILKKLRHQIVEIGVRHSVLVREIKRAEIVVDAIFGVGLNREVCDPFRAVIETINQEAKRIVSVDTPSGLDGTTGKIYGICVKADCTVTFSFVKKGFLKKEGLRVTGKVVILDIGIPKKLQDSVK